MPVGIEVVIPSWNAIGLLERCLRTLADQSRPHTVIVVDNGSADGTVKTLRESWPDVRVVELEENLGFGTAVNRGVASGEAPLVVLVNNDVECDSTFVERLVAPLEGAEDVGMVAGLLLQPGRALVDSYGLELDRTLAAFPRFAGTRYYPELLHERHLAAPSGGAAAYRRGAYEAIGGFDEQLFAYMEDVDLALRFHAEGWRCAGAPGAVGVHVGSATAGRRSRRQVAIAGASRGYMLRKYGILRLGIREAATTIAAETVAVGAELLLGRNLAALKGRIAGWNRAAGVRAEAPRDAINESIGLLGSLRRRRTGL